MADGVMADRVVDPLSPLIEEVVCDVLSSMCFAAPEFSGEGVIASPIVSAIQFSGEISGELCIALTEGFAKQMAADFLGTDAESVSLESANSFTLELANVMCGAALAVTAGEHDYEVSLPCTFDDAAKQPFRFCFSVGGGDPDVGVNFHLAPSVATV